MQAPLRLDLDQWRRMQGPEACDRGVGTASVRLAGSYVVARFSGRCGLRTQALGTMVGATGIEPVTPAV